MIIKVRVDVCRGGKVAVAQSFLDLLHRNAVGKQEARAAVMKIVQTNDTHTVRLQNTFDLSKVYFVISGVWGISLSYNNQPNRVQ